MTLATIRTGDTTRAAEAGGNVVIDLWTSGRGGSSCCTWLRAPAAANRGGVTDCREGDADFRLLVTSPSNAICVRINHRNQAQPEGKIPDSTTPEYAPAVIRPNPRSIIATGTAGSVSQARKPPNFLVAYETAAAREGEGRSENPVVPEGTA